MKDKNRQVCIPIDLEKFAKDVAFHATDGLGKDCGVVAFELLNDDGKPQRKLAFTAWVTEEIDGVRVLVLQFSRCTRDVKKIKKESERFNRIIRDADKGDNGIDVTDHDSGLH